MAFLNETGLNTLWEQIVLRFSNKQDKLTGTEGQVVGFKSNGDVISIDQIITASSNDGVTYTATHPALTSLTIGTSFVVVFGRVSSNVAPTLNVNGLGAKNIRRRLSNLATSLQAGYSTTWLPANKPFTIVYDGTAWVIEGLTKPVGTDIYGSVPKATGDESGNNIKSTYATKAELAEHSNKGGGSGEHVPPCTTADNGKFLRVVDGVATWSTVPNAEDTSF